MNGWKSVSDKWETVKILKREWKWWRAENKRLEAELEASGRRAAELLLECDRLKLELAETRDYLDNIRKLVAKQAMDNGLWMWFEPRLSAPEAYMQAALRRLHEECEK